MKRKNKNLERALHEVSFEDVLKPVRNRGQYVYRILIELVHDFFVILTVVLIMWVPVHWVVNSRNEALAAIQAERDVMKWPRGEVAKELHAAQAYNQQIAASGQTRLGEVKDPFNDKPDEDTESAKDATYQSLLKGPTGVMGTIRIPKVSIHLPIYHGTARSTLTIGSGHLYGTSVPVGGKSTNAVLTGHRGLPNALLFTRIDELKKGDIIYINTLNHTMGYRVKAIHVIDPKDVHLYKVVPGKDLVTLMTCTPYGVNTERLVITAERGNIPQDIPPLVDAAADAQLYGLLTALVVAILGFLLAMRKNYRELVPPPWHYDGTPIPKSLLLPRFVDKRGLPPMGVIAHRRQRPPGNPKPPKPPGKP
ncbi:class C sortase [Bifidobacterium sp. ESL0728]|uniref:class C sortase n=1 Tax=Bifidobacterium sp. ESL0728 TaxID=2983220 RepID=UPI0023F6626D|nr:class C sortase [Bifidobacterium sp. ESL0728]WEV58998.1 class C sortase [Bifidobacterium sp. ESL0728]